MATRVPEVQAGMAVQALIQAAGDGSRLGLGPKAFVMLGGRTLLERAVDLFRGKVDGIVVAVPAAEIARAQALAGGDVVVIAGGARRSETTRRLVAAATAPWLLLHDVVHPFAPADLIERVLAAAYAHRASAPGIANSEFLYDRDGRPLHAPGQVLIGQKPVAFAREAALAAFAVCDGPCAAEDPSLLDVFERAGLRTKFVEGSARNLKITGPADLALAEALLARRAAESWSLATQK
jgi:2-C-methyl-D-erythritol 4-phosphate cytidylyltransferase